MPIFVSKHWPTYTRIRQVRRGLYYWTLLKLLTVSFVMRWDMVLQHFGFGQNFRRWIQVLFTGTLASLMFNGRLLAPFKLGSKVRKGDPPLPALLVLFIEPFHFLRATMQGLGLQCGSLSHSVNSFSDDCTGLLHDLRHT